MYIYICIYIDMKIYLSYISMNVYIFFMYVYMYSEDSVSSILIYQSQIRNNIVLT